MPLLTGWKKTLFWMILVIGAWGFAEAASSLFYYLRLTEQEREPLELALGIRRSDANTVLRYVSHPYFNFISNPDFRFTNGYQPHNSMGLRGPLCCSEQKKAGQLRIVAAGGSTTYGMSFTYERNTWPALLEQRLRAQFGPSIDVINAGTPYYTTYELIGLLAMRIPEFSPDVVLIHAGFNDAFAVGSPDEGGPDNTLFRHAYSYQPVPGWLKRGMKASYLLRLLGLPLVMRGGSMPGDMAGVIQYHPPPDSEVLRYAEVATGKYFRRNLQTLVALCRNMGAVPVLINEPVNPAYEASQDVYHTAVVKTVHLNNRISREIASSNRLTYIDLYSAMRDARFFVDGVHENQAGMEIKAEQIATHLAPLIKTRFSRDQKKKM